jgi:hypothetical protein
MGKLLAFVPDLMFGTRIADTARHLGYQFEFLNSSAEAEAMVARISPALIVVALDAPGWDQVVAAGKGAGVRVLAFGSHRDVNTLRAAQRAGCDKVLARSQMAAEMPSFLDKYLKERSNPE